MVQRLLKKGSITSRLLEEMVDDLDLVLTFGYRPLKVLKYGMEGVRRMRNADARRQRRRAMQRLKERKLIQMREEAGQYYVALTSSGLCQFIQLKIADASVLPVGDLCIVVFDIPEVYRALRKRTRDFLRRLGFVRLQRSVWASPLDVAEPLSLIFRTQKKVGKWVRIFTANEKNH
jgi:CRISPR-associated endonuclease Cas2